MHKVAAYFKFSHNTDLCGTATIIATTCSVPTAGGLQSDGGDVPLLYTPFTFTQRRHRM